MAKETIAQISKSLIKKMEEFAIPSSRKWGFFPDDDQEAYHFYQIQKYAFWDPEEIDFSQDFAKFSRLPLEYQGPLLKCLVIFQTLDGGVIDTLIFRRLAEAPTLMEKLPYLLQLTVETLHSESYRLQLDAIIKTPEEREKLMTSVDREEWIKRYRDFVKKYTEDEEDDGASLSAQAVLEGVGFSALFAVIFWYKKSPDALDIPGITGSNDQISIDEGIHRDWAVVRFRRFFSKITEESIQSNIEKRVKEIVEEMISIIEMALPIILAVDLPGLTKAKLLNYSKFVADSLLINLGFEELYNVENELNYMTTIGGAQKNNFYEKTVTQYSRRKRD